MKLFIFFLFISQPMGVLDRVSNLKLATDDKPVQEVVTSDAEAYIAVFEELGVGGAGPPGETNYAEARLRVIRVIKGRNEVSQMTGSFNVTTLPEEAREELPILGQKYIVVGPCGTGRIEIRKLLVASKENEKIVGALFGVPFSPAAAETAVLGSTETSTASLPLHHVLPKDEGLATSPMPNEEPPSSTSWSVLAIVIMAAGSLLWLLLKRRN